MQYDKNFTHSASKNEVETKESLIETQLNGDASSSDVTISFLSSDSFHTVVFDCHAWTIMDSVGMETIKQVCFKICFICIGIFFIKLF